MLRKKTITPEAARLRMADLCARAEHCRSEIEEKLRKMQLSPQAISDITDYLEENRYIDNCRFARAFARDKVKFSGWGRNKIRMALAMKRIDSHTIADALLEIDETEYLSSLTTAARGKARNLDLRDRNDYAKLFRHLASRGFEASLISGVISKLKTEEADSE